MSDNESSSGGENSSGDEEEFQESELKKKVLELDTENKNLKKRLNRTITLFDSSREEIQKMNKKMETLKSKQKKIQKRSATIDKETNSLKHQLEEEKIAKTRLRQELRKTEETLSDLRNKRPTEPVVMHESQDVGMITPPSEEIDDDEPKTKKRKMITKTIAKIHRPLHGVFLVLSLLVELCFWIICTVFYLMYFVQLREIFTDFTFRTGWGAFIIIFYILVCLVGFLNTLGGIVITICIFMGWSWCSVRLIIGQLFFSGVMMIGIWACFFLSFILSIVGIAMDKEREVNIVFLICHLVLYVISLLCVVWTVALIYAFIRENDECTKKMCVLCFKFLPIDMEDVKDKILGMVGGFGGGESSGGLKKKKKKRRKSRKADSDSDEPLELESGDSEDEDFIFERASDDEEIDLE